MATPANPGSNDLVYEAIGLKKHFDNGQVMALRGVDLQIRHGEFVAIVGPSGCGKSTLLAMLGSLDKPSEGSISYRGQSIPDMADQSRYRSHEIGFVFQAFHLLPTYTVSENVQIPMFEGKLNVSERKARAEELLKSVGLGHRLTHFPSELSGGERQRVAIARGLANKPSVVLADEPTGNLDSVSSKAIMDLLKQLHRDLNMTVVLVTHDPNVAALASRTIRIKDGQIISDVTADSPNS
jgi:ABC-type lipoprotein export system ATPase subunit